jgi:transcriptional antiterminator NusG
MYAGYIIIQADISNGEVFHTIKSTPSIIGFLSTTDGANKTPVPLRVSEVQRMLGQVDEANAAEEKIETPFIVGETVKVTDGPFAGFSATVENVFDDRKKLSVVVKIFGRNTPMELSYVQVEKEVI